MFSLPISISNYTGSSFIDIWFETPHSKSFLYGLSVQIKNYEKAYPTLVVQHGSVIHKL